MPPEHMLPEAIDGVETDVVETGRFVALRARARHIEQRRLRPARPGCSAGFQFTGRMAGDVMAGTFGAFAEAAEPHGPGSS